MKKEDGTAGLGGKLEKVLAAVGLAALLAGGALMLYQMKNHPADEDEAESDDDFEEEEIFAQKKDLAS